MCQQNEDEDLNDIRCLNRECDKYGVNNIQLFPEELDTSEDFVNVKWERYEYMNIPGKGGKMCRKLQFVTKETTPGIMFQYLFKLLTDFPAHQHRAKLLSITCL